MRLFLGPMEGVLDHLMRDMLTQINPYDVCVTEFIRVVDQKLPTHVFHRLCPELNTGGTTPSGVPVYVQLLGQEPHWMAENAQMAAELGALGIDINFGCPAKTVNKNKGGAALLQTPDTIYQIIQSCRSAIPKHVPLSAKIRLGWESADECFEIVDAIEQGGASEITIHARTKFDGYKADAIKWAYIKQIKQRTQLPLIANGEIWNAQDAKQCITTSGVDDIMVCRGAFNTPNLGQMIKHNQAKMPWDEVLLLLLNYSEYEIKGDKGLYYPNRIKQWLNYLKHDYPEAKNTLSLIKCHKKAAEIVEKLQRLLPN